MAKKWIKIFEGIILPHILNASVVELINNITFLLLFLSILEHLHVHIFFVLLETDWRNMAQIFCSGTSDLEDILEARSCCSVVFYGAAKDKKLKICFHIL